MTVFTKVGNKYVEVTLEQVHSVYVAQEQAKKQAFENMFGTYTPPAPAARPVYEKASAGTGIGKMAYELINQGFSNAECVEKIKAAFPQTRTNVGCMNWYRAKLKRAN